VGSQYFEAKKRRFAAAIAQANPSDLYPTVRRRTRAARRWRPYQTDDLYWRISNHYKREAMQWDHRQVLEHRQRLADAAIRAEAKRKREEEQAQYVEMVNEIQPSAFEEESVFYTPPTPTAPPVAVVRLFVLATTILAVAVPVVSIHLVDHLSRPTPTLRGN